MISLIGIFATGFITIMDPAGQLKSSRDGKRKSDVKKIQAALELYRADCDSYPASVSSPFTNNNCKGTGSITYISSVPGDPRTNGAYVYCTASCGVPNGYRIYACLEKSNDRESLGAAPAWLGCQAGSGYFYAESP